MVDANLAAQIAELHESVLMTERGTPQLETGFAETAAAGTAATSIVVKQVVTQILLAVVSYVAVTLIDEFTAEDDEPPSKGKETVQTAKLGQKISTALETAGLDPAVAETLGAVVTASELKRRRKKTAKDTPEGEAADAAAGLGSVEANPTLSIVVGGKKMTPLQTARFLVQTGAELSPATYSGSIRHQPGGLSLALKDENGDNAGYYRATASIDGVLKWHKLDEEA